MPSERNTAEQITTIAVVILLVIGTAWLLVDLAKARPAGAGAFAPTLNQPSGGRNLIWSEGDVSRELRGLQAHAGESCPVAG